MILASIQLLLLLLLLVTTDRRGIIVEHKGDVAT